MQVRDRIAGLIANKEVDRENFRIYVTGRCLQSFQQTLVLLSASACPSSSLHRAL